jgi:hypothetical protein
MLCTALFVCLNNNGISYQYICVSHNKNICLFFLSLLKTICIDESGTEIVFDLAYGHMLHILNFLLRCYAFSEIFLNTTTFNIQRTKI